MNKPNCPTPGCGNISQNPCRQCEIEQIEHTDYTEGPTLKYMYDCNTRGWYWFDELWDMHGPYMCRKSAEADFRFYMENL